MSELVKTFAELLKQFAYSVDIVDQGTFDRVRDHVVEYMRNELEAAYWTGRAGGSRSSRWPSPRRSKAANSSVKP